MLPISNWLIYNNYPSQFLIVALSVSIFSLYSKKQIEKFAVFIIFFRAFSKLYKNKKLTNANFCYFYHSWTFSGITWGPSQNLGPMGSTILKFIGYTRTDKQAKSIYTLQ